MASFIVLFRNVSVSVYAAQIEEHGLERCVTADIPSKFLHGVCVCVCVKILCAATFHAGTTPTEGADVTTDVFSSQTHSSQASC